MKQWAYDRALASGYVLVTGRSVSKGSGNNARKIRIDLRCDRHGEYHTTATVRSTGSKKLNCPFMLIGRLRKEGWKLEVKHANHNHDPFIHAEGHAFARRLTPQEEKMVETLYFQGLEPANIHLAIRAQNPDNVCILRDIHNTVSKIKRRIYGDKTPMQVLLLITIIVIDYY
jgi:histone-lysine N-methyltransferase SETD2